MSLSRLHFKFALLTNILDNLSTKVYWDSSVILFAEYLVVFQSLILLGSQVSEYVILICNIHSNLVILAVA